MTGFPTGSRPDSTGTDRNARPEPTGFPYRGEPAVGENRSASGARKPWSFARAKARAKALLKKRERAAPGRVPCGARRRRDGKPCEALSVPGKRRCKWHGGCATGPKTPEGKARAAANLRKPRANSDTSRACTRAREGVSP